MVDILHIFKNMSQLVVFVHIRFCLICMCVSELVSSNGVCSWLAKTLFEFV